MAGEQTQSWAYAEDVCVEDSITARAREDAREYDITCISPATGSFLGLFAAATKVRSAVEVGTGTGVSGLYLLRSSSDIMLTTIDVESEAQHSAKERFRKAGIRPGRARIINGPSADILPRLADRSYDLVFLDGAPLEMSGDVNEALRMLRPGGVLIIAHALMHGRVADPARREEDVVAIRDLNRELMESADLRTSLIPVGDGLLLASLR
ncbi:MAG: O-methyltransferase [Ancrocorticia sp.]|uniref:O-methyltransferase n=1 Tax=Ancrocorticia sp. TaxID=2593684 RepID=UPI003F90A626